MSACTKDKNKKRYFQIFNNNLMYNLIFVSCSKIQYAMMSKICKTSLV